MEFSRSPVRRAQVDGRLARRMTLAYAFGLLVIGLLTTAVHLLLDRVILDQRDSATIINVAGRQRMLSQRIALLSNHLKNGDEMSREPLHQSIALMARSHAALIDGNDLGIIHPLPKEMRGYYFEGPNALDPAVRSYIAAAREFTGNGSPEAYGEIQGAARESLLQALDGAVTLFEHQATRHIEQLRRVQKALLGGLLLALVLEALLIFRPLVRNVGEYSARLGDLAAHDGLTGLFNRRYFMDMAQGTLAAASHPHRRAVSILMIDLDLFKRVNDTYGHSTGDRVLQQFAEVARKHLREGTVLARIGGEEFAVLLPETNRTDAEIIAQRLRHAVATSTPQGLPAVTVSVGVATLRPEETLLDELLGRADHALYQAKMQGRNRVCVD